MPKVIISGTYCVEKLPSDAIESLDRIIDLGFEVLVGDAGFDLLIQQHFKSRGYKAVTVYFAQFNGSDQPRSNAGFPCIAVPGNYRERDKFMCAIADYGLVIWDGKSKEIAEIINRVARTRVYMVESKQLYKNSVLIDGVECYVDPEGWACYQCELDVCDDGCKIEIGNKYITRQGEALIVDKILKQYCNTFAWRYVVIDEDGDTDLFMPYEFIKKA